MQKYLQLFRIPDLRNRLLTILGLLLAFRVLAAIPTPGVNLAQLKSFLDSSTLFGFLNIFSGGGLSNLSIVMLGVGPYITATIVMQLLTIVFPGLKKIYYEEGAMGQAKFNRISRYLTVPLAALQSYGLLELLKSQGILAPLTALDMVRNIIVITAGSIVLMWIGELITEQKMGNGVSLIIFAGIVSGFPQLLQGTLLSYTPAQLPTYVAFVALSLIIIAGVVFINEGERKIPISYAKRIVGNRMYGGVSSYLPLKINQAGVIPIIFAISVLLFPQFIAQIIAIISKDFSLKLQDIVNAFLNNQLFYALVYFLLVLGFTYFYTAVTFNPEEIAKNLQQSGGSIPGIRPGEPSGKHLKAVVGRVTLFGAIFLGLIAVLPIMTRYFTGIQVLSLGGTTLLIVVAVALETMKQIDSQLVLREYEGIR